ncbi:MAG: proton-conducting transporter membrane subunit [Thermoplasmatota archaeon]
MIPLIVTLPLFFAFFGMLSTFFKSTTRYVKAFFLMGIFSPWSVFLMNMSDYPVETVIGGWTRISGIEVVIDELNFHLIFAALIVFSVVGVYSLFYFDKHVKKKDMISSKSVLPLILLAYSGVLGCFLTRDLFNFFVYTEIASISSIILVSCSREEGSKRAAYRYLVLFLLSTFFFLFSIGIIYMNTGTLNFYMIKENIVMTTEVKVAISMAFVAFITKAGIFPLYFWLPEAYSKADTPISAMLSGLTEKVPIFGMILFLVYIDIEFLTLPLMIIAFSSILFGIVMAILQKNVKKILAYSTVSQLGFILLAIATLNASAAVHYAFAHALFKSGLFLGVGVLITRYGTKNIDELSCKNDNLLMLSIIILTLAIGGVSPLIGAFGKHEILSGLSGFGVYLFYIGSIGTLTYFINLNYSLFNLKSLGKQYHSIEGMITFIVAILTVAFGVYYYPKLKIIDLVLIGAALAVFVLLKRARLFEKKMPRYFSKDIKGLGSEINLYTSVFVSVMIVLLAYIIY